MIATRLRWLVVFVWAADVFGSCVRVINARLALLRPSYRRKPEPRAFAFGRPIFGTARATKMTSFPRKRESILICAFDFPVLSKLELLRQDAAERSPVWRGEQAEDKPAGDCAGCAVVRCQYRDVPSANPGACSRTRRAGCPEGVPSGVCFFGYFLCTSTAPQERREQRSWPRSGEGPDARSQESDPLPVGERKLLLFEARKRRARATININSGFRRNEGNSEASCTPKAEEQECGCQLRARTGTTANETRTGAGRRTSVVLRLAAAALLACLHAANAPAAEPAPNAKEAEARQQLEHVREEIRRIVREQRETHAQRDSVTDDLRARELQIAATAKELRALDQKLSAQQARLGELVGRRTELAATLKTQRDALAALLRSAYALGRNEELRLLLLQDDIDSAGRMLAYYHYFERARVAEIDQLLAGLEALAQVQKAISEEMGQIARSRAQRAGDAGRLESERDERRAALGRLEATLKDQRARLAALGRDEKDLTDLIARLRDVFADIPKRLSGAEPFARLRGRLAWPLQGSLSAGVAEEGEGHGILIAAAEGSEVRAVSHGRVVFADWLRGYGLLLIIDHGDGYLSLYGCNEALLKDVGDWVDAGDVVATSGASGGRRTPGLYFELRHDGKPLDAHAWLRPVSHHG